MVHNDISIAIIIIFVCYSSSKEASIIDSHTSRHSTDKKEVIQYYYYELACMTCG